MRKSETQQFRALRPRTVRLRRIPLLAALVAIASPVLWLAAGNEPAGAAPRPVPPGARSKPQPSDRGASRLIVRLRNQQGNAPQSAAQAARRVGIAAKSARSLDGAKTVVVQLPARLQGAELEAAMAKLASDPGVASVEPDRRLYAAFTPNDPKYPDQWNLRAWSSTWWSANAAPAWDITTGSPNIVVAVVDTGYTDHPDLAAQILPGYDFVSDTLTANDGGGRDADAHDPGDWVTEAESFSGPFSGCTKANSSWHGTHVSGIVGATGNNAVGVAGMAWTAKILPVRALGKCGGDTSDVIDAIRWAAGLTVDGVPTNANPAQVINLSLGGATASCGTAMQNAITEVINHGVVVVTAAGNSSSFASGTEPGNCSGVINVAATGRYGERASYSNYGAAVTLAAPGGTYSYPIRSTINDGTQGPTSANSKFQTGTSMAAPHVAGAAALLLSVNPGLSPSQLRSLLTATARPFPASGSYSTCTAMCGAGVVDTYAALVAAGDFHVPDSPTDLVATPGPSTVSLSWNAPAESGGNAVTDYVVQRSSNNGYSWVTVNDGIGTDTAIAVTGLANGRTYVFRVAAVNDVGTSSWSTPTSATPATVPGSPRVVRSRRGPGQVRITWLRPRTSGGASVVDYVISQSTDGILWTDLPDDISATSGATITGLTNGTRYYFRVAAVNSAGQGAWSYRTSSTPLDRPGAPTDLVGSPGNRSASLSWTAPEDNGGTQVTRYTLQRSTNGGLTWSTVSTRLTSTARTVRYLTNGNTYLFRVAARNAVGLGAWSEPFSVTPRTQPSAPLNVVAVAGDTEVTLSWGAPTSSGGTAITAYRVTMSTDGVTWNTLTDDADALLRTYTAPGLENGVTYYFRVAAINEAGVGSYSSVRTATPVAPAP